MSTRCRRDERRFRSGGQYILGTRVCFHGRDIDINTELETRATQFFKDSIRQRWVTRSQSRQPQRAVIREFKPRLSPAPNPQAFCKVEFIKLIHRSVQSIARRGKLSRCPSVSFSRGRRCTRQPHSPRQDFKVRHQCRQHEQASHLWW